MATASEVLSEIMNVIQEYKQWRASKTYVGFPAIKFKEAIFNKYPDLAEKSPRLFTKAVEGDFEKPAEMARLNFLVQMSEMVSNDASNYDDVSKQVNHKFSTDFGVYDVIDDLEKKRKADL